MLVSGLEQKFVCLVHSGKIMCGKITCKVKPLISQDHLLAEILYYLVERNSMPYNVSEVSEHSSLRESKTKA